MKIRVNSIEHPVPVKWQRASLLSFLRDHLALTGTKFGCGKGLCGACTVHLNDEPIRSCIFPVIQVEQADVRTIEGLPENGNLHPVQQAWIEESVPQCGYCQPGQMMTAAAFLSKNANPSRKQVVDAMNGNLCRCGTYLRIQNGVLRAAEIAMERIKL